MKQRTRKRVWVDRQIQGALALRVAFHWVVFAFICGVLTLAMQFVGNPFARPSEHFANLWKNQGLFLIVLLFLLPVFVYDTAKLSNRFAGPILRLRRNLQSLSQGHRAERLSFRDGDFWAGLASDYNKLIDQGHFSANQSTTTPATSDGTSPPSPTAAELQEV